MTPRGVTRDRVERCLLGVLATITGATILARMLGGAVSQDWLWACGLAAYLPAHATFVAAALALVAAIFAHRAQRAGPGSPTSRWVGLLLGGGAMLAVALLPDRSGFVGDFLLRQGAIAGDQYARLFPQSLPLDRFVFGSLFPVLARATPWGVGGLARGLGLLCLGGTVVIAVGLARRFQSDQVPATVGGVALIACGTATLFAGFARDTILLVPLAAWFFFAMVDRVSERPQGSPAPELILLAMLALHRSALTLVVPYLVGTFFAWPRCAREPRRARWFLALAALGIGALSLAPAYGRAFTQFDLPHHTPWMRAGGLPALPLLRPGHVVDVANAIFLLAPVVLATPLTITSALSRSERWLMLALAACSAPYFALFVPQQGVFRDYDVLALPATLLACVGFLALIRGGKGSPGVLRWFGTLTVASSVQGFLLLLLVGASPVATRLRVEEGISRLRASESGTRAQYLDYLVARAMADGDTGSASRYAQIAVEIAATPLHLTRAGLLALGAEQPSIASMRFESLVAGDSNTLVGWSGLLATSLALGDSAAAERDAGELRRLTQDPRRRAAAIKLVKAFPALQNEMLLGILQSASRPDRVER